LERVRARLGRTDDLSPEQHAAREWWQHRWNLPILLAAFVPLFVTFPSSRAVQIAIGVGSWLVFLVDLVVQRRIVPGSRGSASSQVLSRPCSGSTPRRTTMPVAAARADRCRRNVGVGRG
jgi:hypothetical protein